MPTPRHSAIIYPDSEGKRMADNTKQAWWIVLWGTNISALFHNRADVFVAIDNLWYPVEGHPEIRTAPDVYIACGRPKGDRGSYKQWEEGGIPLTVVFEVLSPQVTEQEKADKFAFYLTYGVEEYYLYDPDSNELVVFLRQGQTLTRLDNLDGFSSPRLGIRFSLTTPQMQVFGPDGRLFRSFEELTETLAQTQQKLDQAEQQLAKTEQKLDQIHADLQRLAKPAP